MSWEQFQTEFLGGIFWRFPLECALFFLRIGLFAGIVFGVFVLLLGVWMMGFFSRRPPGHGFLSFCAAAYLLFLGGLSLLLCVWWMIGAELPTP